MYKVQKIKNLLAYSKQRWSEQKVFPPLSSILLAAVLSFSLTACSNIRNIGKSEIDMVADLHLKKINTFINSLTVSLYKNNPEELNKGHTKDMEARLYQIINHSLDVSYIEINYLKGVDAIKLVLDKNYQGDRVFALMVGISGMLERSYNGHKELFITDTLDPQKLYSSAVNLQRIQYILNDQNSFLNLGDDREKHNFNNMIIRLATIQDMMAEIFANRNHSHINKILHGTTAMLIPIV